MAALNLNAVFFNHEISFCKVYNAESREKLEKLLVSNRISFFIEWPERHFWERILGNISGKQEVFTIHINEADTTLARDLAEGIESVQIASA
ncbi:MAG: hypothetical protein NC302_13445 [Bacteroidales bacterium]|nr:hypothetical protein [Bacteroidales bacterium]MCM1417054.1 hypothetical protein [bacterium]MCM1424127.1 hypothetical protein [bacterium]